LFSTVEDHDITPIPMFEIGILPFVSISLMSNVKVAVFPERAALAVYVCNLSVQLKRAIIFLFKLSEKAFEKK